jgi:hypothetical protein
MPTQSIEHSPSMHSSHAGSQTSGGGGDSPHTSGDSVVADPPIPLLLPVVGLSIPLLPVVVPTVSEHVTSPVPHTPNVVAAVIETSAVVRTGPMLVASEPPVAPCCGGGGGAPTHPEKHEESTMVATRKIALQLPLSISYLIPGPLTASRSRCWRLRPSSADSRPPRTAGPSRSTRHRGPGSRARSAPR